MSSVHQLVFWGPEAVTTGQVLCPWPSISTLLLSCPPIIRAKPAHLPAQEFLKRREKYFVTETADQPDLGIS